MPHRLIDLLSKAAKLKSLQLQCQYSGGRVDGHLLDGFDVGVGLGALVFIVALQQLRLSKALKGLLHRSGPVDL